MANARFLLHDRDAKFSEGFDAVLRVAGIQPLKLPPQSPNLNAFAERWVRSVKDECLDQMILFGERSLRHSLNEYVAYHQHERNHQGLDNVIPFPSQQSSCQEGIIRKIRAVGRLAQFLPARCLFPAPSSTIPIERSRVAAGLSSSVVTAPLCHCTLEDFQSTP